MLHIPTIAAVLGLSACAVGQSFSYTSFANTPELNKLGSCVTSPGGSSLVLTDGPGQTGWVWHTAPVDVQRGFDTTFEQRIALTPSTALGCGFAFVIHGDPDGSATMGGGAWGLGYGQGSTNATGIRRSLAIEFDVFRDAFIGDVYHQEISVHTRGPAGNSANEQWAIARVDAPILLSTLTRPIRIRYVPGTLEIYHTNLSTPILSVAYDFTQGGTYLNGTPAPGIALGNDFAYVGFSAATRASSPTLAQIVRINSWTWSGKDCASGTLANNMLTINGSAGGVGRRVEIAPLQAFSLEVGNPSSAASSSPYVLFASLQPQPNAPGTIVGPVRTCFPVLPMGPNEFVLADSFGFFAGSAPAPTTPHAFLFPFGVYNPFPSLTLQAVTLDVHTLQIEVSNAIELAQPPTPTITSVSPLSAAPGQPITVAGSNFALGATLTINGALVTANSASSTAIVFPYPTGIPCDSEVTITTPAGMSASSALNPVPVIQSTPSGNGPAAGGSYFSMYGSGFTPHATVTIGGNNALVAYNTNTIINVWTPAGTPGPATVVVTTPGGCTATTTYTYQ